MTGVSQRLLVEARLGIERFYGNCLGLPNIGGELALIRATRAIPW